MRVVDEHDRARDGQMFVSRFQLLRPRLQRSEISGRCDLRGDWRELNQEHYVRGVADLSEPANACDLHQVAVAGRDNWTDYRDEIRTRRFEIVRPGFKDGKVSRFGDALSNRTEMDDERQAAR